MRGAGHARDGHAAYRSAGCRGAGRPDRSGGCGQRGSPPGVTEPDGPVRAAHTDLGLVIDVLAHAGRLDRSLELMRQVIEEGRNAVRGLRSSRSESLDLEEAFALVPRAVVASPTSGPPAVFRVIVVGEQRPLHPLLRDEVLSVDYLPVSEFLKAST